VRFWVCGCTPTFNGGSAYGPRKVQAWLHLESLDDVEKGKPVNWHFSSGKIKWREYAFGLALAQRRFVRHG
jgi:hypothetical protein